LVYTYGNGWATIIGIFTYTGSAGVKISKIVVGGYFFDTHCSCSDLVDLTHDVNTPHKEVTHVYTPNRVLPNQLSVNAAYK